MVVGDANERHNHNSPDDDKTDKFCLEVVFMVVIRGETGLGALPGGRDIVFARETGFSQVDVLGGEPGPGSIFEINFGDY